MIQLHFPVIARLVFATTLACCTLQASAQNVATKRPDPVAILTAAKVASGGSAWNTLGTQHSLVTISTAGIKGSAERWSDISNGRSLIKYTLGPVTGAAGYDGIAAWSQDGTGQSRVETSGAARELAVNAAYRDKLAFWFPDRAKAEISFMDRVVEDGATFDIIGIVPEGGRPFQFWINADTHLIERLVEREAQETRTEYLMDIRSVEGVKVPYRVRATRGDPRHDEVVTVDKLDYNWPLTGVVFAQPTGSRPDFTFANGSASIEVPFEVRDGYISFLVMLNGKGPFRMVFDGDRGNILSPRVLAEIGVKPEGNFGTAGVGENQQEIGIARINRLEVGGLAVDGMLFSAIDVSEYMARVEGIEKVSGIVGFELFKRFPVKLDYQRGRATFYDPSKFTYAGGGVGVPVRLREHTVLVEGIVDGNNGLFAIDTSSGDSVSLAAAFVEKNGLLKRYGATQSFVSGANSDNYLRSQLARANWLKLGGITVDRPVTALSTATGAAADASDIAGSIGYGVLRQFNITFDYANGMLYFEKNVNYGQPDTFDRSGMWIELRSAGFGIVDVMKDGPAAKAGLVAGDVIVAVDGKPWSAVPLATLRQDLKAAPGTKVKVRLASGQERIVTLRDLI